MMTWLLILSLCGVMAAVLIGCERLYKLFFHLRDRRKAMGKGFVNDMYVVLVVVIWTVSVGSAYFCFLVPLFKGRIG